MGIFEQIHNMKRIEKTTYGYDVRHGDHVEKNIEAHDLLIMLYQKLDILSGVDESERVSIDVLNHLIHKIISNAGLISEIASLVEKEEVAFQEEKARLQKEYEMQQNETDETPW